MFFRWDPRIYDTPWPNTPNFILVCHWCWPSFASSFHQIPKYTVELAKNEECAPASTAWSRTDTISGLVSWPSSKIWTGIHALLLEQFSRWSLSSLHIWFRSITDRCGVRRTYVWCSLLCSGYRGRSRTKTYLGSRAPSYGNEGTYSPQKCRNLVQEEENGFTYPTIKY